MKVEDSLQGVTNLFLDTAPVIYAVEGNPKYLAIVRIAFEAIDNGFLKGICSPITLAECLVHPCRFEDVDLQQIYIELLLNNENITCKYIDREFLAIKAAQMRAKYNLQLPDAFQVAAALAAGCEAFLTNDVAFRRVTEIRAIVLDDLEV